jgi:hypothetical protein
MFETLKALLRRVDLYLRNEPYSPPSDDFKLVPFEDVFDDPKDDPLRTRAYWVVRRFWTNHWLCNLDNVYREVKFAYQRVTRGWDDRAVWSIDYWLDGIMPDMLRRLKVTKHGTPMTMFPTEAEYIREDGNPTDAAHDIASRRWDETLDKMIAGFEASARVKDGLYEKELGEYPSRRPEGVDKETWNKVKHDRYLASRVLEERDEKIFKEGMALFTEHYWSLWD